MFISLWKKLSLRTFASTSAWTKTLLMCCAFTLVQCTDDEPEELEEVVDDDLSDVGSDLGFSEAEPGNLGDDETTEPVFEDEPLPPYAGPSPVYFGLDEHNVTPDAEIELGKLAQYLKDNPQFMVQIEGHCDERGTVEYNLALGERRALTVKNFLANLGVEDNRLSTISYGEERPATLGNDEFAWSQNRRVEFVVQQN